MKKVNELLDQMKPMRAEVKRRCKAYLKRTLKKAKNHRLDFCGEDGVDYGNEYVCVTYDGGRHPEYATNAFSQVYGAFLDSKGNIMLEIEDCEKYEIERIDWNELVDVADYVYRILIPYFKKEKIEW